MHIKPSKTNANHVGELLRREFFQEERPGVIWWELRDDVFNHLTETKSDGPDDITFHTAEKKIGDEVVEAYWYWDEDYFLSFTFKDGSSVSNYDAKKDYGWEYTE